jgi:hypothetical protein
MFFATFGKHVILKEEYGAPLLSLNQKRKNTKNPKPRRGMT